MGEICIHIIDRDSDPSKVSIFPLRVDDEVRGQDLISWLDENFKPHEKGVYLRARSTLELGSGDRVLMLDKSLKEQGIKDIGVENECRILKREWVPASTVSVEATLPGKKGFMKLELPIDAPVELVLDDLVRRFQLPSLDSYGRKLAYALAKIVDGNVLSEESSVNDFYLQAGDELAITEQIVYEFDVFISYDHEDADWVYNWLSPQLKQSGLRVFLDRESSRPGAPIILEMERAILNSRGLLLIVTPNYLESEYSQFENILAQTLDPIGLARKLIPLRVEDCTLPPRLNMLSWIDFTDRKDWDVQMTRLLAALHNRDMAQGDSQILYKRENIELTLSTIDTRRSLWQELPDLWEWVPYYLFARRVFGQETEDIKSMFPDLQRRFSPGLGWFFVQDEFDKYRTYPQTSAYGEKSFEVSPYERQSESDQELFATVLEYLQNRIESITSPLSNKISRIQNWSALDFYHEIVLNGWWQGTFDLGYIQDIWPSDADVFKIKAHNRHLYQSLEGFYYRFLRSSDPIFDFTIKNLSGKTTLLTEIRLAIYKNWSYPKGPSGAGGLLPLGTYELEIEFKESVNSLRLDPPIYIKPNGVARFKLVLRKFYENCIGNNTIAEFIFFEGNNVQSRSGKYMFDY